MRLEEAFNKNYNRFTENEQYICRYLLEHKKECAVMITEFAGSCHVSESMLVRFAKKNGLAGYGELKARLRLEEQETEEALGPGEGLLNTVTDSYHKMMDELIGRGLDSLFEKLYRARRVFLYGSQRDEAHFPSGEGNVSYPWTRHAGRIVQGDDGTGHGSHHFTDRGV